MLLKCDAAQLEWRVKVFLAQDKVGMKEIANGEDLHTDNQKFFGLPSRLIAKIFIYRMIFADAFGERGFNGPAYAYAHDSDFQATSKSVKYWEAVVEKFFEKYPGIHQHSLKSIQDAVNQGYLTVPSGRYFPFAPRLRRGVLSWPNSDILNYPVQGFSAELVQVARLTLAEKIKEIQQLWQCLLINTVHDDVEADVDNDPEAVYNTSIAMEDSFRGIPKAFEEMYGSSINVPMDGEVKYGMTLDEASMHKFNRSTFFEDWKKHYG